MEENKIRPSSRREFFDNLDKQKKFEESKNLNDNKIKYRDNALNKNVNIEDVREFISSAKDDIRNLPNSVSNVKDYAQNQLNETIQSKKADYHNLKHDVKNISQSVRDNISYNKAELERKYKNFKQDPKSALSNMANKTRDNLNASIQNSKPVRLANSIKNTPKNIKNYFSPDNLKDKAKTIYSNSKQATINNKHVQTVIKAAKFIYATKFVILAMIAVLVISSTILAAFLLLGRTPHYYCDVRAPKFIKQTAEYKRYCRNSQGGNESIAQAALTLSDAYFNAGSGSSNPDLSNVNGTSGTYGNHAGTNLYVEKFDVYSEVKFPNNGCVPYCNCVGFVNTVLNYAGVDYAPKNDPVQSLEILRNHESWEEIPYSSFDDLEPGDVLVSEILPGSDLSHIMFYIGSEMVQEYYPHLDSSYVLAESGYDSYGGIVSNFADMWQNRGTFHAFRYIGKLEPKE